MEGLGVIARGNPDLPGRQKGAGILEELDVTARRFPGPSTGLTKATARWRTGCNVNRSQPQYFSVFRGEVLRTWLWHTWKGVCAIH